MIEGLQSRVRDSDTLVTETVHTCQCTEDIDLRPQSQLREFKSTEVCMLDDK